MHSLNPLSFKEILKIMPTNKSISDIYNTMILQSRLESSIPTWGDAIVWSELHICQETFPVIATRYTLLSYSPQHTY